jgi:signal transduction histidine kinase
MLVLIVDVTDEVLKERKLTAALELSKKLLEPNISLQEITETVLSYAKELTGSEDGYVAVIDEMSKDMVVYTFTAMMDVCKVEDNSLRLRRRADGKYPALFGHSLNTGEAFYTNDIKSHEASTGLPHGHIPLRNALFYPVTLHGKLVGQIALANCTHGYNEEDMRVIEEIATIYALAIKGYVHFIEENKFQEIFNNIVEGICVLVPIDGADDFIISDMNNAAQSITGVSREKILGSKLTGAFPAMSSDLMDVLRKVSTDGTPVRRGIETYDDGNLYFITDSYIFRLPTGYVVVIFRDLTELHAIQGELKEMNENLLERVEKEVGIRRKQEQVIQEQKKLADLGQMINAIAHQWRQPINVLGLYTQEVADLYSDNELTDDYMEEFEASTMNLVNHLSNTIDDFRFFFKTDKEKNEFEVLDEVMALVRLLKVQFNAHDVKVSIDCECKAGDKGCHGLMAKPDCVSKASSVVGFRGEFRQVVLNIMHNAADAIKDAITAGKIGSGQIRMFVDCIGDNVVLKISDNGTGIPEKILDKVFNPYFTTKEEGKGTGIGLYMSKIVIEENMKGKLSASNDDGAVFTITLPKAVHS